MADNENQPGVAQNENQDVQLKFHPDHNIIAFLDADHSIAQTHRPISNFLKWHRLIHALTKVAYIVEVHIREFWENAEVINDTISLINFSSLMRRQ